MAHTDTICNGGGCVALRSLPGGMHVITPEAHTSETNCRERKLGNETKDTLHCNGFSQLTSDVRSPLPSMESPSVRIDRSYKLTAIQEFYRGANVLITGGTGFMGKVLLEKLLRSCPHLRNIYLLVRKKKGKDVGTRIQEVFEDPLFEKLKAEQHDFRQKVLAIEGDCVEPGLGLSPGDRQRIVDHVDVVFHAAATVRFDEKLPVAVAINVAGTRELLTLCYDCQKIKAVVHVSTAFSHCNLSDIDEEFYDPPITADRIISVVQNLDENTLTTITPMLLHAWPNTYAYTKAIAEDTVRTSGKDLPIGVFRPSIILCTRSEPVPGWIDNLYGPTGAVVGVGLGMIRTMHINGKFVGDMIPCDMAVSALVASAWDVQQRRRSDNEVIPIYNYVSSCENPISWGNYIHKNIEHSWQTPFEKSVWMVTLTEAHMHFLYRIYALFIHLLPALAVDIVLFGLGQKPRMMKTYEKLHKFTGVISYFCTRQWKFSNQNVQKMWNKMSEDDREIFDFNIRNLNWDKYLGEGLMGVRTFVLKDDPKKLPEAIKKRYRLYWLHQCLKFTLLCLFLWLCWLAASYLFGVVGGTATVGKEIVS